MVTNEDRADWAQAAVTAFQDIVRTDDEDAIGDLLADLAHLIRRNGHDPEAVFASGLGCFREEEEEAKTFEGCIR